MIAQEVAEFLQSPEPQIICIFGKWGIGKTFAWRRWLRNAQMQGHVTFNRYAYVSLFGRTSIADARDAIVENTVDASQQGLLPSVESFDSFVGSAFRLAKQAKPILPFTSLLPFMPKTAGFSEGLNRVLYLAVKEQIICIDDLERAGEKLRIGDILGLASELKEQKRCKVVLLLNQEELVDPKTFQEQLEKVADLALAFDPSPPESADIAIEEGQVLGSELKRASIDLGLVNIRVIRRAVRLTEKLAVLLHGYDDRILQTAVRTLVLGCYAKFQPGLAPPLSFIREYNSLAEAFDRGKTSDADKRYGTLLNAYGYGHTDDFDSALFDAVETGALDAGRLTAIADEQQARLTDGDQQQTYRTAWRPFNTTFEDNEAELLDALESSVVDGLQTLSPGALSVVVKLMRDLGYDARADQLISIFMARRQAVPRYWDLAAHHFTEPVDEGVRRAFAARFQKRREPPSLEEAVGHVTDNGGWNDELLNILAAATADDYYALFKGPLHEGADRGSMIDAVLHFGDFGNASPEMLQIARAASDAVRRIGMESRLNALRIHRYRLTDPAEGAASPPSVPGAAS